jgi:hypothetical protein
MADQRVPVFTGSNWKPFNSRIRASLAASKLAAVFNIGVPEGADAQAQRVALEQRAKGILALHVEDAFLDVVEAAATTVEALAALEAVFVQQSVACIASLRCQLRDFTQQPGERAIALVARAKELRDGLAAANSPISESDLAIALLAALPAEYAIFRELQQHHGRGELSIDGLLPHLLLKEQQIMAEKSSRPKALFGGAPPASRSSARSINGGKTWDELRLVDDPGVREFGIAFASGSATTAARCISTSRPAAATSSRSPRSTLASRHSPTSS